MKITYAVYVYLTSALLPFLVLTLWLYSRITGRYRPHFGERLGIVPSRILQDLQGKPRIWVHAASLGEVRVAAPIIHALRQMLPTVSILLSVVTDHGRELAVQSLGNQAAVISAPLDFLCTVRKALSRTHPHAMVFLETELWPIWICEAHRMGIQTALVNGRISETSHKRYLKLKPLFRSVLDNVDGLSMIQEIHAKRIITMGADPRRVTIQGNAKYDMLGDLPDPNTTARMRRIFNVDTQPVFIAGSTRRGEENLVLDAYEKILNTFPDTILILAPRHVDRTRQVAALLRRRGFRCQLRSDLGDGKAERLERAVILNSFGELFNVYSVGTIVFVGASLVPLGGQNPLEPAAWGKTVLYGPHMENFLDAIAILEEANAGFAVGTSEELADKAVWFLSRPDEMDAVGSRARDAVRKNQGAAERHARCICRLLEKKSQRNQH
jgi:3-deoxy-D-manno-octulosonic-acid transferase